MDTDELSRDAYNAVIIESDRFHHDLTLQFGVRASDCKTENEFLNMSELLIKSWLNNMTSEYLLEDIFFDNQPNKKDFELILDKVLDNILKVRQIPIEKRKFDKW